MRAEAVLSLTTGATLLKGNEVRETSHQVGYIAGLDLVLEADLIDSTEETDDE